MTRAALLALLALYVDAQRLTEAEARALVRAWDAGLIGEGDLPGEPLAPGALATLYALALRSALRRLARAFAASYGQDPGALSPSAVRAVLAALDSRPLAERLRLLDATRADDLRGALSREAQRRTAVLFATPEAATFGPGAQGTARLSAGSVRRWQEAMRQAYAEDAAALARLGAGGPLTPAQEARLARVVASRAGYVDRFAVDLTRMAAGEIAPLSEAQIRAAIVRRSGDARSLFFENAAERETAGMAFPVIYYRALDDPQTCEPCAAAEAGNPYRVGEAPLPGSVCLGGGYCRCTHEYAEDPAAHARLNPPTA